MIALTTRPVAEPRPLLLTARQAAEAMGISERTMWEITKGGRNSLPADSRPRQGEIDPLRRSGPGSLDRANQGRADRHGFRHAME